MIPCRQVKREPKSLPDPRPDFGRDCLVGSKKLCCPPSSQEASPADASPSSSTAGGDKQVEVKAKESRTGGRKNSARRSSSSDAGQQQVSEQTTSSTTATTPEATNVKSADAISGPGVTSYWYQTIKRSHKKIVGLSYKSTYIYSHCQISMANDSDNVRELPLPSSPNMQLLKKHLLDYSLLTPNEK